MGNIILFLIFGLFAYFGVLAFYKFVLATIVFWLQNGYWEKSPTKVLFGLIFVISHGGIGFGGLYYLFFGKEKNTLNPGASTDSPWLRRSYWAKPTIFPDSKFTISILNFIFYYLAIISPIAFLAVFESLKRQEYKGLYGLLIPAVASLIFFYKKKLRQQIAIHGKMPLQMNPYPGSIDGQIGGSIEVFLSRDNNIETTNIQLQCLHHSRNGDDSKEEILWDETMIPLLHTTLDGKQLQFSFNIDALQEQSQAKENSQYIEWWLSLEIELENGQKLKNNYRNLPVFNTAQQSTFVNQQAYAQESSKTQEMNDAAIDKIMPFSSVEQSGHYLNYPIFRNLSGIFIFLIGIAFIAMGFAIPDRIFNIVFPLLGCLAALGGIYSFFNSLEVHIDPIGIQTKRYLFGILIKTITIPSYELKKFKFRKTGGMSTMNKTVHYYEILAISQNKQKTVVVEGICSLSQARLAIERLEKMLDSKAKTSP